MTNLDVNKKERANLFMSTWTKESILENAIEKNVQFIRLMFTDIHGSIKNVEIPLSQLAKALDNDMSFDGSSIDGFARVDESDMYLRPDYNSWLVYNWEQVSEKDGRIASLICDVEGIDRQPFKGDPRSNLRSVLKKMEDMGFSSFNLGPEPEFFLLKLDENGEPTMKLNDQGGYFDLAPIDTGENCRRDIVLELERLGFEIEASHHESGPGQHEIDWKYNEAIKACDNIQVFKYVVKSIARQHNLHATFMPKPFNGISGSGMHFNVSLFDNKGNNAFFDESMDDQLSQTAHYFIGGLMKHVDAFTAICNPLVNSYKRLVDGYEAPGYVAWGETNRTPLIRIPHARGNSTRVEVRSVDPAANPYLALAVILQAGLDGIENKTTPPNPVEGDINEMSRQERSERGIYTLPKSLDDALEKLADSPVMEEALGSHIKNNFLTEKWAEYNSYRNHVSSWEQKKYLMSY